MTIVLTTATVAAPSTTLTTIFFAHLIATKPKPGTPSQLTSGDDAQDQCRWAALAGAEAWASDVGLYFGSSYFKISVRF